MSQGPYQPPPYQPPPYQPPPYQPPPYQPPPYQPPPYQPPPYQPTPYQPPPRKKRTWLIVTLIVVGVVLTGAAVFLGALVGGSSVSAAKVGDCLQLEDDDSSGKRKDCADPAANFVVLGVTDSTKACVQVVGSTATLVPGKERTLCLGLKGADLARAVNGAKEGDCLDTRGGDEHRAPCGPGTQKILKILRNELRATGNASDLQYKCASVSGTDGVYAWSLETKEKTLVGTYDLIFCLGPQQ